MTFFKFFLPALFLSAGLFFGLTLSHDSDDEIIYTALASKTTGIFFEAYNLRDVSIKPQGDFWALEVEASGNLLGLLTKTGPTYYDTRLFFNPPFYPTLLALSKNILIPQKPFLVLKRGKPLRVYFEQFYLVLPNLFFGALFLWGVFFLGKQEGSGALGVAAALFCLASPVFLVSVFKTWTDLPAAALILWALIFWRKPQRVWPEAVISAILMGLAVLTRTSSLLALPLFFTRQWKVFLLWLGVVLAISGGWFYRLWDYYGTPFYFPAAPKENLVWLESISRPWYFYLLDLVYLWPIGLAAVFARRKKNIFFFVWFLYFLVPLSFLVSSSKPLGLEDRYLLPCYPALALLAAKGFERMKVIPGFARWILPAGGLLWSFGLGIFLVLSRESLKLTPF
jgi:hypothetical protein